MRRVPKRHQPEGKEKKNPRKRPNKWAKKASDDSSDKKEEDKGSDKAKSDTQPCKFLVEQSIEPCQPPAGSESCRGCGASLDTTVSSIPHGADWPVSFPLQSTFEYVFAAGLQPETMVSRLSKKLGGRLAHCEDSYEKIGTDWGHIDIIRRGYKPTWIGKAPRQRIVAHNPSISAKASNFQNG